MAGRPRLISALQILGLLAAAAALAWLSQRFTLESDWSGGGRNSLSPVTQSLLSELAEPVEAVVFTADPQFREVARLRLRPFSRAGDEFRVRFVNPDAQPEVAEEYGVAQNDVTVLRYSGQQVVIADLRETSVANALFRLARRGDRWLVFITGHGERSPHGVTNHDLQEWVSHLLQRGLQSQTLNLAEIPSIPANTAVLVIASPQVSLLPGEVAIIKRYVAAGGNLLWLLDPGNMHGLEPLAHQLSLDVPEVVIVDPTTRALNIENPLMVLGSRYSDHPLLGGLDTVTVYPRARPINSRPDERWRTAPLVYTGPAAWGERSIEGGSVGFAPGEDIQGPLQLAVALNRKLPVEGSSDGGDDALRDGEQRIVVVGDGDFLANAYLGNGGNLALGMKMVDWLAADDRMLAVPARAGIGRALILSQAEVAVIGFGFLFGLPLVLLAAGFGIRWRRRRR